VPENNWFAAYTRPHHEKVTATSLQHRGYEVVYPRYQVASRWKDRVKKLELPLFPGYLFVRCDPSRRLPVLQSPGLLYLVSDDSGPVAVPEPEVESIRLAMLSRVRLEPVPFLKAGDRVVVQRGPMAGVEGILLAKRDVFRVVISVEMLARSVAVEVDGSWLARN